MSDRDDIKQFSSSWRWTPWTTPDENLMVQIATNGGSFFQHSGDHGAWPPGTFTNCVSGGSVNNLVFPRITIVGGTELDMAYNGVDYRTLETAWASSAGGIETCVPVPAWQVGVAGENGASGSSRMDRTRPQMPPVPVPWRSSLTANLKVHREPASQLRSGQATWPW